MTENDLRVEIPPKKEETDLTEIKKNVCALLNANGGELTLTASAGPAGNRSNANKVIRPIEQYFESIIGTYEVHKRFHVLKEENHTITLEIQALPFLCTLNTYLFMSTNTEIVSISCNYQHALRYILFERRFSEYSEQKVPEQFAFGSECGFHESNTVRFKLLDKTNQNDFADRVINNKFTEIISGFANAAGGNIFYGIDDDGIVEGEQLSDSEHCKTTEKLEEAVEEMIWQDKSNKVERGKEWDIKFVPVKDCNNETIPSTFVMVVTVNPYIGGVFTKEPESYYLEDGEVKKISFDIWRRNTYHKVATPGQELERSSWSSSGNRRSYMRITQTLENFRQCGNWERIKEIIEEGKVREDLLVNDKLTCLFQNIASCYYQGELENAISILKLFRKDMDSAEDKPAFAAKERYSSSAIERSRGNYQEAWEIIDEALKSANNAPAGNISAAIYANAASVLRFLVDDETSSSKIREHVDMAKSYCHHALQHLFYIEDEFEIAREDLKQRIEITLASLCVKSADPELSLSSSPNKEIDEAMKLIGESEQSLMKIKGTERLTYNSCRQMLVKSDIYFLMYKLESAQTKVEHLKKSLEYVQRAQQLADDKSFKEIRMLCEKRSKKIKDENKLKDQENIGEIVDKLLA